MEACFGFKDGSGDWFLVIDTDRCDGCGKCISVCPSTILEVGENEFDPMEEKPMAKVKASERKKLKYSCAACKPGYGEKQPLCIEMCPQGALSHSEAWKLTYCTM